MLASSGREAGVVRGGSGVSSFSSSFAFYSFARMRQAAPSAFAERSKSLYSVDLKDRRGEFALAASDAPFTFILTRNRRNVAVLAIKNPQRPRGQSS